MEYDKKLNFEKKRNIYVELLRCFAMVGVIVLHFNTHGWILQGTTPLSLNWLLAYFLEAIFYVSVPLFYLISSYYLYNKVFNSREYIKRVVHLWCEISFYSFFLFVVSIFFFDYRWTIKELFQALFPIMFYNYGFFNSYLLLTIMVYPLSKLVNNIDEKVHRTIIGVLILICSILPYISFVDVFNVGYGQGDLWLILIAFTGMYINKYKCEITTRKKTRNYLIIALISMLLTFSSKILIALITKMIFGNVKFSSAFYGETPLLNFIAMVSLFMAAICYRKKEKMKYVKIINFLASNSFAVYLITDNNIIRKILWNYLEVSRLCSSPFYYLFFAYFVIIIIFYLPCVIVEEIRKKLYKKIKIEKKISDILYLCFIKLNYIFENGINIFFS